MREIKFRAWDNGKKEWLLGYEYPNLGGFSLGGECVLMGEWANVCSSFMFENDNRKRDDLKIMQYTGLKDKNGVDIYEGDILQETNVYGDIRGEVLFSSAKFIRSHYYVDKKNHWLKTHGVFYDLHFYQLNQEVIGNIYQNPELL